MRIAIFVLLAICGCGRPADPPAATPPPSPPKKPALIYGTIPGDAAKIYEALAWKKEPLSDEVAMYSFGDAANQTAVDRALEADREGLAAFERAARADQCLWNVKDLDHFKKEGPKLSGLVRGGRLLRARLFRLLEEGKQGEAIDTFLVGAKVASDHMVHPQLISKLVGCVQLAMLTDAFQTISANREFVDSDLERLERHVALLAVRVPTAEQVLVDERACILASVDPVLDMGFAKTVEALQSIGGGSPRSMSDFGPMIDGIYRHDRAASRKAIIETIHEVLNLMIDDSRQLLSAKEPSFKQKEFSDPVTRELEVWMTTGKEDPSKALPAASKLVIILLAPMHIKIRENFALTRFRLQTLILWSQLQRMGMKSGAFPATLAGRSGLPVDPYDGQTVKYLRFQGPDREAFIVSTAWPGGDWKTRLNDLHDTCRLDLDQFRELSPLHDKVSTELWIGRLAPRPGPK